MKGLSSNLVDYILPFVISSMLATYFLSDDYTMKVVSGNNSGVIINKRLTENYSIGDTILFDNQKVVIIKID